MLVVVGAIAFLLGRNSSDPAAEAGHAYLGNEPVSLISASSDQESRFDEEAPGQTPRSFYQAEPAAAYFVNCSAARAAGAAPVRVGDPGYAPHLDRDHDGVGCE